MSEVARRRSYWYNAILIDSSRVLTPQFDDAVIYVTGAQLELLRNVTQYLNRRQTYAAETHDGYYLVPDDADYDDILEIVADLEEVLMGNPNTLWGYKDNYSEFVFELNMPAGTSNVVGSSVPDGEVWRVTGASFIVNSTSVSDIRLYANLQATGIAIENVLTPVAMQIYPFQFDAILKDGDYMYVRCYGMTLNDDIWLSLYGYKMDVPET